MQTQRLTETFHSLTTRITETDWHDVRAQFTAVYLATVLGLMGAFWLHIPAFASGDWTPARVATANPIEVVLFAVVVGFFLAPVFQLALRLRRPETQRDGLKTFAGMWLGLGVMLPLLGAALLIGVGLVVDPSEVTPTAVENFLTGQVLTFIKALVGTLFLPAGFVVASAVRGAATGKRPRRRAWGVTVALVLLTASAIGGVGMAYTPSDAGEDTGLYTPEVEEYSDGETGPSVEYDHRSEVQDFRSAAAFTGSGDVPTPPEHLTSYEVSRTEYRPAVFEVAPYTLNMSEGEVVLTSRFVVKLSDEIDAYPNAVVSSGVYALPDGDDWTVTDPDLSLYGGSNAVAENVETVYLYVDVVEDGRVVRYYTEIETEKLGSTGE